jgi:succinate dehydrogenase hydrophobic anchor subunit
MNKILVPENNLTYLKNYHKSSKLLIPLIAASYLSNKTEYKKIEKTFHFLSITNIAYHSYFSTSCIISDYIKPKSVLKAARIVNLNGHILASFGFYYYLLKLNYK